jgi:hypothetical protein
MRPQGLVASSFKSLETVTTSHVIKFYLIKLPYSRAADNIGDIELLQMNESITKFVKDQKSIINNLKSFKTHIKKIHEMKEQELKYYVKFAEFL